MPRSGDHRGRLRPIAGRHNPLVKELRRAFHEADISPQGYCAVEGVRILEEAIRSGLKFRAIFFRDSSRNRAERWLPQMAAHVETVLLSDKLFASAVPSENPQGVAALVLCPRFTLADVLEKAATGPLVAIAGVQDPGNLGTILRSAEAFGARGVLLGEGTVSPFNSKALRASAGSTFRLTMAQVDLGAAIAPLRSLGLRLLATSSHKGKSLGEVDLVSAAAIFIGSEGSGISRELLSQMDEVLAIPHAPAVESLNAGVAASIVLYEAARQRRA
jgi:TrmH family RNA methyltransferase